MPLSRDVSTKDSGTIICIRLTSRPLVRGGNQWGTYPPFAKIAVGEPDSALLRPSKTDQPTARHPHKPETFRRKRDLPNQFTSLEQFS